MLAGAALMLVVLVALALWSDRKRKKEIRMPRRCRKHPGAWQRLTRLAFAEIILPYFSANGKNECSEFGGKYGRYGR